MPVCLRGINGGVDKTSKSWVKGLVGTITTIKSSVWTWLGPFSKDSTISERTETHTY
jgi:hypothetical protein